MNLIQLPFLKNKYVLAMIGMDFHWVEAFLCWRAIVAATTKILLERIFQFGEPPQSCIVIGEPALQDKLYTRYVKFVQYYVSIMISISILLEL